MSAGFCRGPAAKPAPFLWDAESRSLMFGELFGRKFGALDVACIQFRVVLPLLGQIVQRKNRRDRTDGHASAAVDTFHGVNVELRNLLKAGPPIVVGRVLFR